MFQNILSLMLFFFLDDGRYLNNNNLTGKIPDGLENKPGLDLRYEEWEPLGLVPSFFMNFVMTWFAWIIYRTEGNKFEWGWQGGKPDAKLLALNMMLHPFTQKITVQWWRERTEGWKSYWVILVSDSDVWELKIDVISSIPLSHLCPVLRVLLYMLACCIRKHQFRDRCQVKESFLNLSKKSQNMHILKLPLGQQQAAARKQPSRHFAS